MKDAARANVATILDDLKRILEEKILDIEDALKATSFSDPARLSIAITWKPATDRSVPSCVVSAKVTLPATGADHKIEFEEGQMRLL